MKISGHKTPSVFDRREVTNESDLTNAAKKLESAEISRKLATENASASQQSATD